MKNLSIQGLRGIAALMVFLSHALSIPNIPYVEHLKHTPFHIIYDGQVAVMLFIVLSGFFYYKQQPPSFYKYWESIVRKFFRVCIPYFIIITIGLILCNHHYPYDEQYFTDWGNSFWQEHISVSEYIKQLSILWPHDARLIDPPTWYVPVETRLFIIIPIIVMISNVKRISIFAFLPIWILMVYGYGVWYGACLIGCTAHLLLNNLVLPSGTRLLNFSKAILLCIGIFAINITNEIHGLSHNICFVIQSIGASIIVSIIFMSKSKFLSSKVLVWLGDISYEFYLIHFIVFLFMRSFFVNATSYIIMVFIISLVLAHLLHAICQYINLRTIR